MDFINSPNFVISFLVSPLVFAFVGALLFRLSDKKSFFYGFGNFFILLSIEILFLITITMVSNNHLSTWNNIFQTGPILIFIFSNIMTVYHSTQNYFLNQTVWDFTHYAIIWLGQLVIAGGFVALVYLIYQITSEDIYPFLKSFFVTITSAQ